MFDELQKYRDCNHFLFKVTDNLTEVCNAPSNKSGIYLVYALGNGKVDLIYIGRSGKVTKDGKMFVRKTGLGGIKDRLINGYQFGKIPRRKSWPIQMLSESIEALDIYWYITHNSDCLDCPRVLEKALLKKYENIYGRLPRWNKEI